MKYDTEGRRREAARQVLLAILFGYALVPAVALFCTYKLIFSGIPKLMKDADLLPTIKTKQIDSCAGELSITSGLTGGELSGPEEMITIPLKTWNDPAWITIREAAAKNVEKSEKNEDE